MRIRAIVDTEKTLFKVTYSDYLYINDCDGYIIEVTAETQSENIEAAVEKVKTAVEQFKNELTNIVKEIEAKIEGVTKNWCVDINASVINEIIKTIQQRENVVLDWTWVKDEDP